MPLTYASIGMPERGSNRSDQTCSNKMHSKSVVNKAQKLEEKEVKNETVGEDSLIENEEFVTKNKRTDKKRKKIETSDDVITENKKRLVIGSDGKAKSIDDSTFHKQHEIAKSNRKKEKAKLYKKKSKQKKKNKQQQPVIDDEKMLKECTEYLNKWKDDKTNWKFEKLKQIKLVQNMFHPKRVSDEIFPIFVEYIAGSAGHMRNLVSTRAMESIQEMEKWCEMSEEEREQTSQKPDETKYNRAREIVQALDE